MPSISEFKKNKKDEKIKSAKVELAAKALPKEKQKPMVEKRRPGRSHLDGAKAKIKVVEVDPMISMNSENNSGDNSDKADSSSPEAPSSDAAPESKVEINFPGSEVLRAKFPKSFETAENVVTDWVNDGKFEKLTALEHPLAKAALQQGLLKAKEIEKKVMASPVTEKVTIQAFTYAMKAQTLVNQLKSKVAQKPSSKKSEDEA